MGRKVTAADTTREDLLVRRLGGRKRAADRGNASRWVVRRAERENIPTLLPASEQSKRRSAHGERHVHLHARTRRRRAHEQLDAAGRGESKSAAVFRGRD